MQMQKYCATKAGAAEKKRGASCGQRLLHIIASGCNDEGAASEDGTQMK